MVKKDLEKNIIFVSNGYDPASQYSNTIPLEDIHWLNPNHDYSKMEHVKFKIRHQPEFNSGKLLLEKAGNSIFSETKISGIAPGQFAVLYDLEEKTCIGSAVISER